MVLAAVLALTGAGTAPAQEDPTTTTSAPTADPRSDIIPEPDSGRAPEEAGDRGGALQLALLAVMLLAVLTIVLLVWRESRRASGRSGGSGRSA